jgi:Iap family predicted aminopeptidase
MPATQTASHPADGNPPSFESVWAILQETAQIVREVGKKQEETDRIVKETARQMKETDRQMKETDRQIQEYNKRFGEFTKRFGEVVEYMVAPNLREKFWEMGLKFNQANSNAVFSDDNKVILFEVDVLLQNGGKAMLVEVKTTLTTEDVKDHIARLEKMRKYADLHGDKRAFLGAVAGVVMTSNVKEYALKQGFYVIEPSGETFNIIPPNGQPKEW